MASLEDFLNTKRRRRNSQAIRQAEQKTSGEIRVHIEDGGSNSISVEDRAKEVFQHIKNGPYKTPKRRPHLCRRCETSVWNLRRQRNRFTKVNLKFLGRHTRCDAVTLFKQGAFKEGTCARNSNR